MEWKRGMGTGSQRRYHPFSDGKMLEGLEKGAGWVQGWKAFLWPLSVWPNLEGRNRMSKTCWGTAAGEEGVTLEGWERVMVVEASSGCDI